MSTLAPVAVDGMSLDYSPAALAPAVRKLDRTRTDDARAATIERRHERAMKRGHAATRAGRRARTA